MSEGVFARGSSCQSVEHAIQSRLNLPTNWYGAETTKQPGLAFAEDDLTSRESYARTVAKAQNQLPCVVMFHIQESNFQHLKGNIWNAVEPVALSPTDFITTLGEFRYEPIDNFRQIRSGVITVAVAQLSDHDLIAIAAEVGFEYSSAIGFRYKEYKQYL